MLKVTKRNGFSDRNGINKINTEIQVDDFDERTRTKLYNCVTDLSNSAFLGEGAYNRDVQVFYEYIYDEVYSVPINRTSYITDMDFWNNIKETIMEDTYDAVLTIVECMMGYLHDYMMETGVYQYGEEGVKTVFEIVNELFEREYVGYRFIDRMIIKISDQNEIRSLEETLNNKYEPVRTHMIKASKFLADRDKPDYANSIKESISAVEALCKIVTGETGKNATLGHLLKELENKGIIIQPALKSSMSSLYGYTSDSSGIRHGMGIGDKDATFEEAKYMLVVCSAFINYVMAVMAR